MSSFGGAMDVRPSRLARVVPAILGTLIVGVLGLGFVIMGSALCIKSLHNGLGSMAIIGVPFALIGCALLAAVVWSVRLWRRQQAMMEAHPQEPWLWDADWAEGNIPNHAVGGVIGSWILALIWNGISIPIAVGCAMQYMHHPDPKLALVLIFPPVGIWLAVSSVRETRRVRRFGKSTFQLQTLPAALGGSLAGTIHVTRPLLPTGQVHLRLTCTRTDNSNDSTINTIEWEDEQTLDGLPPAAQGSDIPVYFEIPTGISPSSTPSWNRWITWQLEASAQCDGIDFRSRFNVPVFRTDSPVSSVDLAAPYRRSEPAHQPPEHLGITIVHLADGGCTIHFAAARNLGLAIFQTFLAVVITTIAIALPQAKRPFWAEVVVCVLAIAFDLVSLNSWLASATVTARASGLHIDRGLPLLRRRREVPADTIMNIVLSIGSQMNSTVFYTLSAACLSESVRIAGGIRGKKTAEWLAMEMKQSMGIAAKATR